jgi:hypothetical protein
MFPVGDVPALAAAIDEVLSRPPHPDVVAASSCAHGLAAAADGVQAALAKIVV